MAGNNYISKDRQVPWFSLKQLWQYSIAVSCNIGLDIALGFLHHKFLKMDVS